MMLKEQQNCKKSGLPKEHYCNKMKTLQECDFVTAANLLGCEVAAIKAVAEVESNYQRNKQFFVTLPATVSEDWKGCIVFFTSSGTLTIPTKVSY